MVHGWRGSPTSGWFPWLAKQLGQKGFRTQAPAMPDTNNPKKDAWVKELAKAIGKPNKDTILVGHSLGCPAILRYLEALKPGEQVGGCILVAGPVTQRENPELESFFVKPFDWPKIKTKAKAFVGIYSVDDYFVPLQHGGVLLRRLGAKLIIKQNMRHFSGTLDGIKKVPDVLKAIQSIAKEK